MTYQEYANVFYDFVFGRSGFLFSCHSSWAASFCGAMAVARGFSKAIQLETATHYKGETHERA